MNSKGVQTMVRVLGALLLSFVLSASAYAQTHLSTTTLTNAINSTQTSFALGAVTGLAAGAAIYVDRELMTIRSVSSLTVTVVRGQAGTVANSHTASRTVILIPAAAVGTVTTAVDPAPVAGVGGCSPSAFQYLPIINVTNGNVWTCRWVSNERVWAATNGALITYNSLIMQ